MAKGPLIDHNETTWVCSFIGTDRSGPVPKAFVYRYCWDRTVPGHNR
jgi:hypothetical protein